MSPEGFPHDRKVFTIKTPDFPQFRFEWHEGMKRVYVIRLGNEPLVGDPIAFEVATEGDAINAVGIWLRGWRAAKLELTHG